MGLNGLSQSVGRTVFLSGSPRGTSVPLPFPVEEASGVPKHVVSSIFKTSNGSLNLSHLALL